MHVYKFRMEPLIKEAIMPPIMVSFNQHSSKEKFENKFKDINTHTKIHNISIILNIGYEFEIVLNILEQMARGRTVPERSSMK